MAALADYTFYTDFYGGVAVPQDAYLRISTKASAFVRRITMERADTATEYATDIKLAACAVADVFFRAENGGGALPQSESMGGDYSAQYGENSTERRAYIEAKAFLAGTGLLYMGV